ncbi:hypothetical protein E2C01_059860 [Portunus trituberculatus]|uniref:Uncharacterized protein n=1 Tax=Portunus trituberculatus TaxID=210409 RepID=A0A5B7HAG5_PORTR|nr:hypothetical protein [Portunus trituberculatus]
MKQKQMTLKKSRGLINNFLILLTKHHKEKESESTHASLTFPSSAVHEERDDVRQEPKYCNTTQEQ